MTAPGRVTVGTANWNDLRGFYPRGTKPSEKLAAYAARLSGVEVNATFFRMIDPSAVAAWADQTPDGFMLSLKAHRFVSAWLRNPDKADARGFERHLAMARPLVDAGKFVAYLLQFPGKLSAAMDLERSLAVLREGFGDLPLAVEVPDAPDAELGRRIAEALDAHDIVRVRRTRATRSCRWLSIRRNRRTRRRCPTATTDRGPATRMSSGPCSTCRTWRCGP